jgi:DNA end-binding protein Ku
MSILSFENQVTKPAAFTEEVSKPAIVNEELHLAKTLIEASTPKTFDLGKYKDDYTEKMTQIVQRKIEGQEIVVPQYHEPAQIFNIMDALKQSLAEVQKGQPAAAGKPPRKMAPSKSKPAAPARKRKSG